MSNAPSKVEEQRAIELFQSIADMLKASSAEVSISSFEMLNSGLVDALLGFLTSGGTRLKYCASIS